MNPDDLKKSCHAGEPRIGSRAGTGVQTIRNHLIKLDSGFRRNDQEWCFPTFYDRINLELHLSTYFRLNRTPGSRFLQAPRLYECVTTYRVLKFTLTFLGQALAENIVIEQHQLSLRT